MDKISFLAVLAEKLADLSLPEEEVQKHINSMQRYLSSISDEEFAADNPSEEDAYGIAQSLYRKYHCAPAEKADTDDTGNDDLQKEDAEPVETAKDTGTTESQEETLAVPTAEEVKEPQKEPEDALLSENASKAESDIENEENADFFEELANEAEDERRAQEIKQVAIERAIADGAIPENAVVDGDVIVTPSEEDDPVEEAIDSTKRPDIAFEESQKANTDNQPTDPGKPEEIPEYSPTDDFDLDEEEEENLKKVNNKRKKKEKREKVKGTPLFWTLFIVTLPITLPILAVICVFFGALYTVVTVGLIALVVLMIALVAVGVALALIGIIYGSTQAVPNLPIALMEIGIGIVLGGLTMLLSVLLYNFSIHIYPKLYKLLNRFSSFVFTKIGDLYYNCKKGVGR